MRERGERGLVSAQRKIARLWEHETPKAIEQPSGRGQVFHFSGRGQVFRFSVPLRNDRPELSIGAKMKDLTPFLRRQNERPDPFSSDPFSSTPFLRFS